MIDKLRKPARRVGASVHSSQLQLNLRLSICQAVDWYNSSGPLQQHFLCVCFCLSLRVLVWGWFKGKPKASQSFVGGSPHKPLFVSYRFDISLEPVVAQNSHCHPARWGVYKLTVTEFLGTIVGTCGISEGRQDAVPFVLRAYIYIYICT